MIVLLLLRCMRVCSPKRLAAVVFALTTFSAADAIGQKPGPCVWGRHIRVSVLFDNSGTVLTPTRSLSDKAQTWLEGLLQSLRPGDLFGIYGLLASDTASMTQIEEIRIPETPLRQAQLKEAAATIARQLFRPATSVDTTDLKRSLEVLQGRLEADSSAYCAEAVILVTDGSLSPFLDATHRFPHPMAAIDTFISYVSVLKQTKAPHFRFYAVGMGAAGRLALDNTYQRAWERENGSIPSDILEIGGRDLLQRAFGRVYGLDLGSLDGLLYRDTAALYPSTFNVRREAGVQLMELIGRHVPYLIIEQSTDLPEICEDAHFVHRAEVQWTVSGSRCMVHTDKLTPELWHRLGDSAPWFAVAQDFDVESLPDTVVDPHQIGWRDPESHSTEICDVTKIAAAVNDGSYATAFTSPYVLHYWFVTASNRSSPEYRVHLVRLPDSDCLVPGSLSESEPLDPDYTLVKFQIEKPSASENAIIFSKELPWRAPEVKRWAIRRLQSLASQILFRDRWLVSGSVLIRPVDDTASERVVVGKGRYHLSNSGAVQPCLLALPDQSTGLVCTSFGGLYVSDSPPGEALIALVADCKLSPGNCHFAHFDDDRPILRLPWENACVWALLGALVGYLYEARRRRSIRPQALWKTERARLVITILTGLLTTVWIAEVIAWTSPYVPVAERMTEAVIPVLLAIGSFVFPSQLRPLVHLLGVLR